MAFEFEIHSKADEEYDNFLNQNRTVASDLGDHFRVLEEVVKNGFVKGSRPVHRDGNFSIHVVYGRHIKMFLADYSGRLLLAHLASVGTEHEHTLALQEAVDRSKQHFGL